MPLVNPHLDLEQRLETSVNSAEALLVLEPFLGSDEIWAQNRLAREAASVAIKYEQPYPYGKPSFIEPMTPWIKDRQEPTEGGRQTFYRLRANSRDDRVAQVSYLEMKLTAPHPAGMKDIKETGIIATMYTHLVVVNPESGERKLLPITVWGEGDAEPDPEDFVPSHDQRFRDIGVKVDLVKEKAKAIAKEAERRSDVGRAIATATIA